MNEEGVRAPAAAASAEPPAVAVEFRVLGPVEALGAGNPLPLGGPRQRTLLALLLVRAGRIVPVDELLDAIWAGEPPDGANTTIRSYVSRLRGALGKGAKLEANASGYAIHVDAATIDSVRFERDVRAADEELARGQARAAAEQLARALSSWRGRAFGDLSDDGPLRVEAERLDQLRLHAVELRFEAELALGNAARLVDEIEAAVAMHPYRERLWRLLMLALYHSGRQADALATYQRARDMLDEQLGIDPTPELQALEGQILRQEVPPVIRAERRDNLPAALTRFIGRDRELGELRHALHENRLVTLTGVGGVGKTRLAVELARASTDLAPDGTVFVDLAPVTADDDVAPAAMRALDVREVGVTSPVDVIAAEVRHAHLILVLDNCEQVRAGAAALADTLRARCPAVRIVATSRIPLGGDGEVDYPVVPLAVPPASATVDVLRSSDAVRLLIDRVTASRRDAGDDASLVEAARICRDLDGLPLAIELAAARAKVMSLNEIAHRLDDRFRFLVSWRRVSAARHQTLRNAIDWSYDLLSADDQALFAKLSVFAGSFRLEAVPAVAAVNGSDEMDALDGLTRLVDASLVIAEPDSAGGPTRYRMLETVRQYAAVRLDETGAAEATHEAHARHYKELAERAEPELSGARQTEWFALLDAEHANLDAALSYLAEDEAGGERLLELTVALARFWYVRGHLSEARRALERALSASEEAPGVLRRRGLTAAASIALLQGDYGAATRHAEASLEVARATGEDRLIANGLSNLGAITLAAGDYQRAGMLLEEAVALARVVGDTRILALALNNLGDHALTQAQYERAEPLFAESLALLEERGDTANVARSLFNLGAVALRTGRLDDAGERLRKSLAGSQETGDKEDLCWSLLGLAALAAARDEPDRAASLLGASTTLLRDMGAEFKPFERQLHDETERAVVQRLGQTRYDRARAAGAALTLAEAVEVATKG